MIKFFQLWILVIKFYFYTDNAIASTTNMAKGSTKVISNHHDHKSSLRIMHSNKLKSNTLMNPLTSSPHECTSEQIMNLDWENLEDEGFLCGPKSVVNEYSVTMLPKGMYFYHGSTTLPHGVIPGGQTKGK